MDFAPITYELWNAFVEERKHWSIANIDPGYVVTDRKRYLSGDELMDPMTASYRSEMFPTREEAEYFLGCTVIQAALTSVGIIHADA